MSVRINLFVLAVIVLLIIKLCGVGISWWAVFSPIWVPALILIGFAILGLLVAFIWGVTRKSDGLNNF